MCQLPHRVDAPCGIKILGSCKTGWVKRAPRNRGDAAPASGRWVVWAKLTVATQKLSWRRAFSLRGTAESSGFVISEGLGPNLAWGQIGVTSR